MAILRQPLNTPIAGGKWGRPRYRLEADYAYEWRGPDGKRRRIVVPKGFEYDGASVPRLAWTLTGLLPDGLIRAAACVHDWLYSKRGLIMDGSYQVWENGQWRTRITEFTREEADRLFARLMREAGLAKWRRRLAYLTVRGGGWIAWRRK